MVKHFIFKYAYHLLFILSISAILAGVWVYHYIEGMSWIDAYYFSVITLATVGYGDITPQTNFGKIFTTIYVLVGIAIIGGFIGTIISRGRDRLAQKVHYHRSQDYYSEDKEEPRL